MNFVLQPWQLFLLTIASWGNRQQQKRINYLETQCAVLMASIDFTTVGVWTKSGLTTFYLLFVMELKTRRVNFAERSASC